MNMVPGRWQGVLPNQSSVPTCGIVADCDKATRG
jgi:hypothetical protein